MAFENVNVTSLRNSINSCIGSLLSTKQDVQELANNISNANIWQTDAQDTLKKALTKLGNERYLELEYQLRDYYNIVNYIEEYKNIFVRNATLSERYSILSKKLNNIEYNDENNFKILSHKQELNNIQKKIKQNKERMRELENNVANSI